MLGAIKTAVLILAMVGSAWFFSGQLSDRLDVLGEKIDRKTWGLSEQLTKVETLLEELEEFLIEENRKEKGGG